MRINIEPLLDTLVLTMYYLIHTHGQMLGPRGLFERIYIGLECQYTNDNLERRTYHQCMVESKIRMS